jgi:hypothetical protein
MHGKHIVLEAAAFVWTKTEISQSKTEIFLNLKLTSMHITIVHTRTVVELMHAHHLSVDPCLPSRDVAAHLGTAQVSA